MTLSPEFRRRSSHARLLTLLVVFLATAFLWSLPVEWLLPTLERSFSPDGHVSPQGRQILIESWRNTRLGLTAFASLAVALGISLQTARRHLQGLGSSSRIDAPLPFHPRSTKRTLLLLLALCSARVALASFHWHDSLSYDELYTLQNFARSSVSAIFALGHRYVANDHILNSLLLKLSVQLGATSESTLRAWSIAASVAVVPVTAFLAAELGLRPAVAAGLLLSTAASPVLDLYGAQMRGYVFAMLLATLVLSIHMRLLRRGPSPGRLLSLAVGNTFLILANVFTLPLLFAQVVHLAWEATVPGSALQRRGARSFNAHLSALVGAGVCGVALHAGALPWLIHDSVVFASPSRPTLPRILDVAGAALWMQGGAALGLLVLLLIVVGALWGRGPAERSGVRLLVLAVAIGVVMPALTRQVHERMTAYVHVATLGLAFAMADAVSWRLLGRRGPVILWPVPVLLAFEGSCQIGAREAVAYVRQTMDAGRLIAAGRPIWTSGFAGEPARFYAPHLRVVSSADDLPAESSVYASFADATTSAVDTVLAKVRVHCARVRSFGEAERQALYECPPFTRRARGATPEKR